MRCEVEQKFIRHVLRNKKNSIKREISEKFPPYAEENWFPSIGCRLSNGTRALVNTKLL